MCVRVYVYVYVYVCMQPATFVFFAVKMKILNSLFGVTIYLNELVPCFNNKSFYTGCLRKMETQGLNPIWGGLFVNVNKLIIFVRKLDYSFS